MNIRNQVVFFSLLSISPIVSQDNTEVQLDWNATEHKNNYSSFFRYASQELHKLNLNGFQEVLNFGCRVGEIDAHIAHKVKNVYAVDSSQDMISVAQQTYGHIPNITFKQANLSDLDTTKQFDIVLSFWTLHWIKDYQGALNRLEQLVKPGGQLLVAHLAENGTPLTKHIKNLLYSPGWSVYSKDYVWPTHQPSLESVLAALRTTQLKIVNIEIKTNHDLYQDRNALLTSYHVLPFIQCIPENKRNEFLNKAIDLWLQEEPANYDGSIKEYGTAVVLLLEKKA